MQGHYYDPKHGGCLRRVTARDAQGASYLIEGVYGDDEAPWTGEAWFAVAYAVPSGPTSFSLVVDFVGKRKPNRFLTATYDARERRIRWCDGNAWVRLFTHESLLREAA